jgi:hypothetical protein
MGGREEKVDPGRKAGSSPLKKTESSSWRVFVGLARLSFVTSWRYQVTGFRNGYFDRVRGALGIFN